MMRQACLARLLSLLERVTGVALSSISTPSGALIAAESREINPDTLGGGSDQGAAAAAAAAAGGAYDDDDDDDVSGDDLDADVDQSEDGGVTLAPKAQTIVTACWLTMKEVSLLTGELARVVPLPGGANLHVDGGGGGGGGDAARDADAGLLDLSQLKAAGERLIRTILVMKHNGAIEKTRVGLACLGERLLRSSRRELSELPGVWLESLFERLRAPGQGVADLIRRSAGIPAGFMAVFSAEPPGVPRALLHDAMRRLLDIAVGVL